MLTSYLEQSRKVGITFILILETQRLRHAKTKYHPQSQETVRD